MNGEVTDLWIMGWVLGAAVVVIAASLLITIWLVALKIARLANVALGVAGEIKLATNSIWALGAANQLTEGNLQALRSIEARADAIARALDNQGRRPSP